MKTLTTLAFAALALGLGAATANATDHRCLRPVEVMSPGHQALTPAYETATPAQIKQSWEQEFAAGRHEAIAVWKAKVAAQCPGSSHLWIRAHAKTIEACDQAMGGRFAVCVKAVPARGLLGW